MKPARRKHPEGATDAGVARSMRLVLAEDFSLLVRGRAFRPLRRQFNDGSKTRVFMLH